ncbi:MAG: aminopeptidase P family protein [Nocardioidaceae bacterium]|nr:aminopeptidase P family protein [Nocardioidaceae bacterium]
MPPAELPFTRAEYAARLDRVRAEMAARGVDTLLVSAPEGMCYLHGYTARWYRAHSSTHYPPLAVTVVRAGEPGLLHLDFARERELLAATSLVDDAACYELALYDGDGAGAIDQVAATLAARGWLAGTVGLELGSSVPNRAVSEQVQAALVAHGATSFVDATAVLRVVRRVKSAAEIALLERAATAADAGLTRLWSTLEPGRTELELWAELVGAMVAAGGEPAASHELVTRGGLGLGHALSGRARIRPGDTVIADPCGVVHRYHANTCRTFSVGPGDAGDVREQRIAGGAVAVLCEVATAGTPYGVVNRALQEYYREHGVWQDCLWAGGYELGLSLPPDWVGEDGFDVAALDDERLVEAGTVTSFHSNFRLPYVDTVVFGADGTRALSTLPRELLVAA